MAYIKKNVNLFLMIIIILIVVSLAGLTTYYQSTYRNLSTSYDVKLDEINALIGDLNEQRAALNETTYELSIREERETELSGQYLDVKKEYDKVRDELDVTQSNLEEKTSELNTAYNEIDALTITVAELQSNINELENEIENLEEDLDDVCDYISEQTNGTPPGECS